MLESHKLRIGQSNQTKFNAERKVVAFVQDYVRIMLCAIVAKRIVDSKLIIDTYKLNQLSTNLMILAMNCMINYLHLPITKIIMSW